MFWDGEHSIQQLVLSPWKNAEATESGHGADRKVYAVTRAQAAAETSALVGTEAIVFRICEAIW
ncbi:conserved hypothetical protein [Mesorhizobium escarrei]|uniref:Uncharacterized protein n=1 Tax=Mesorhizobium escarrei TaxID=666018 RepID=A0ABM9ECB7_9HYPH|nr:conserved hypothetical protein [Mesorhizobium escarrei]